MGPHNRKGPGVDVWPSALPGMVYLEVLQFVDGAPHTAGITLAPEQARQFATRMIACAEKVERDDDLRPV